MSPQYGFTNHHPNYSQSIAYDLRGKAIRALHRLRPFKPKSPLPIDRKFSIKLSTLWDIASLTVLTSGTVLMGCSLVDTESLPKRTEIHSSAAPASDEAAAGVTENVDNAKPRLELTASAASPATDAAAQNFVELNVNSAFFHQLVDDLFYAQNPQLEQRPLTQIDTPLEASLREEWWQTAEVAMVNLGQIEGFARQNLGQYQAQDCHGWYQQAIDLGVDPNTVKNAIATRFHSLFPALANYKNGEQTPGYQVWCAIAQEEMRRLQPGQSLE